MLEVELIENERVQSIYNRSVMCKGGQRIHYKKRVICYKDNREAKTARNYQTQNDMMAYNLTGDVAEDKSWWKISAPEIILK